MKEEQLQPIPRVRQIPGEPRRHWYYSQGMDLTVWVTPQNALIGFQLSYGFATLDHALTWHAERGFYHSRIEAPRNVTPLLVPDGALNAKQLHAQFEDRAEHVPLPYRALVRHVLLSYPSGPKPLRKAAKAFPAKKQRKSKR